MKYSNTVEYNISTKLDSSGLTKLQSQIKQLENSMQQMANRELLNSDKVQAAKTQLEGLNTALTNSFNSSLGILDLSKFRAELDAGGVSAKGLQSAFNMMGAEGQAALNGLTTQIANFNGGMERTSSAVDKVFTTFSNTFRWGMVSSFFSQFMNAIHSSIDYVKELDDSLTQIMLVTDYNRDSMNEFARSANEAAKAVSMTTTGMTNASLIFAQQGYDLGQSQELATLSAKVANASQQDTATTSDQITAYMNAYGLENSIGELTQAMDNWALIANISAADVGELAQASQRAASMANAVGVSGEALAAQIATIESVTREAPEQIGNGLKTLYARFSDISLGGEDEDGIGLGKVTSTLEGIGVKVLDQFGNIRTMDDIMEDLMVVWDDLDSTTKTAAAQALAGKYQVNRFEALMENSDMYRQYKDATGENATGTLDTMNEEYANSIAGRSAKMQASLEGLFSTVFNTDDIYPWMDAAQGAIDLLQQFFDALGGGKTILLGITTLLSQAFNQNIARNINDAIANRNLAKIREQNIATVSDTLDRAGIDRTQGVGKYIADTADQAKLGALSDAQYDNYMNNVKELEQSTTALINAEHEMTKDFDSYNMVMNKLGQKGTAATRSEEGLNTSQGSEDVASNSKKKIQDFEIDFSDDIKQAQELEKQLQEVRKALDELHEANKKGIGTDEAVEKVQEKAKEVKKTLKDIEEAAAARDRNENRTIFEVGDTPKEIETVIDSIEALSTEVEEEAREADKQLGQVEERIRTIHKEAVNLSSDPKATQAIALAGDQKLASDQTVISGLEARKKRAEDIAAGSAQSIINQQQIKDVLDFVQGIQELTVAWQAFQNLGELWSNKDLLIGEKILQTIMNLAVVIPSVIDAYEKLSKVESVIQTLGTLQEVLAAKSIAATAATSGFSVANLALAASSKVAAGGVGILKAALEGLSSVPVVAAVGAIIVALQYLQSEFRKSQEAATESFNKYGEALSQTQIDTSGFDEAYQKYKETGIVSDELRDSALELTESLDITGGEAFVASGNFDALAKSIEGAKKESNDFAESMADKTLSRLEANSKKYIPFMQDTFSAETLTADDTQGIYLPGTEHIWDENLKLNYFDAFGQDISGMDFGEKIEDISKKSEIANKNLDDLIERKERLEKKDPAKLTNDEQLFLQDIEEKIRKAEETANVLESLLGREDVQQYRQITDQEKTRNLNNLDSTVSKDIENQQSVFNTGKYNEAKDYLLQQEGVDTSNVDILIEKYAQLAENEELAAEAALKIRDQQIADNVGTGNFIKGPFENGPFSMYEQKAGMWGRDQIDQLAKDFELSLKDKAKISNMIDWTDPAVDSKVEELVKKLQEGLKNGISLDDLLKSANPEDAMKSFSEMKPIDTDIDEDSFQNLGKYIAENASEMEGFSEDLGQEVDLLDENAELLAEVTEEILRYQDAIDEATEHMDEWLEALDSEDLEERANAISAIQDTMEDLLGLDAGSLSTAFASDAENMQLLEEAIKGSDAAYNELYDKAMKDIVIGFEIDDENLNAAFDKAWGMINDIDGYYAKAEIGAELDDTAFIASLNDMINAAGWSAEEAEQKLLAMGVDADVTQVTEDMPESQEAIGWEPEETAGTTLQFPQIVSNFSGGGEGALQGPTPSGLTLDVVAGQTAHIPGFRMKPQMANTTGGKQVSAAAVKMTGANGKSSGGHLEISNARKVAPAGGNLSGSTKRSNSGGSGGGGGRGGGGGKKSCFVAGTLISTSLGFRPIEQIQKGDMVLSYNTLLKRNEYSEVLQTMIHDTIEPIYTLYIKDEQLRVTGIHRFLVTDKITCGVPQWVYAADLKVGQWVFFADGTWHVIHKIETNIEHQIVYNFEVFANHNYYVGRNQILAHNKGGGKKGSGGGKAKTIEQKEKKNHEKDYYEEVDTQLEKVEKELSRVEKQQDKLVGDKARANQNKQLGLLQKQIELQKEHLRILTEEEKVDVTKHLKEQDKEAEKLVQKYNKLFVIPDPVYDEDGIISNYEQISKAVDDAHNKMIDEYNKAAKTGNEELTKQIQKDIDSLDKYGDAIRKDAQRLDKIVVETEELNNTIQELQDSMQDIRIEAFKNYEEARDGLKDIKESAAELNTIFRDFDPDSFVNSFSIDDTPYDNLIETMNKLDTIYNITKEDAEDFYDKLIKQKEADLAKADELEERMAIQQSIEFFNSRKNNLSADNLNNGYLGVLSQDLATLQGWMDNPTSKDNIFGTDIAALTDTYKETYEALKDGFEEYRKLIQDYRDAALDIYNEAEDAIDRQMDKYDRLVEKVERMSDTYALYYGEDSYAELDKFYAQQGDIMQNQLDQLTTAYEYWNQQYQRALATGDKKLIQEIEDKMNDAEDAMLEKAEELADLWVEKFENVVNANTQSIYDKLFNGNDFNDLTDSWELQKDYMERYKDEVEKSYEIDKLRSKYLDLLNDAQGTSLQTQNKIRQQMQEQLKQLQDQASVSEYDVKLANARLEILQKQIALEDAQRNKNQMQLRRDSQGNYRYTYRANQEDVKAAQDDLLDSEFNAYELTKDETISNNDRALNMVQDFLNKRADIFNKYKDDDEARTKALEQLSTDYSKLLGGMEEDFKDTTNGMYDVLTFLVKNGTEDSATSAANMLDNLFENENKFKEDTEVLWASMTNNITDALENFGDAVEEANGEMIAQTEDLKEKMAGNKGALTTIGSSADTMTDSLDKAAEATKSLATETQNLYDLFGSDDAKLQDALSSIEKYKQELQDTQDTTSSLAQSLKKANATLDTKTAEAQSYKTALDFATGARQVKEGTKVKLKKGTFVHYDRYGGVQQDAEGNTGWRLPEDMWVKFDAPATEPNARYKYGFYATGDSLTSFGKKQPGDNENGRQNTDQRRHQKWWFNEDELQRNVLAAMDTGGYTGEWEDETPLYKNGKLALLHQKELVLNSSDTENILAAVEIVRTIAAGINNQLASLSQNAGIRNFNSSLSSIGNEVQQRVEIKAEFPNVQDSYQIEQALLELSDQAYQYAHRNIRG